MLSEPTTIKFMLIYAESYHSIDRWISTMTETSQNKLMTRRVERVHF